MIINATRIQTSSGAGKLGKHVFDGPKNERIECVQGDRVELDDMMDDAAAHGAKYGIRHFSISPERDITREQALNIGRDLADEFGFDFSRVVIVEHTKPRADGRAFDRHWHLMAPEFDPAQGSVLSDKWMRARHEKIARLAEIRLGHDLVVGRFNAAVARKLMADGLAAAAGRVAELVERDRPKSAFTSAAHQSAMRQGRNLPEDRTSVRDAWRRSDSREAFEAALSESGLTLAAGQKRGVFIVERAGQLVGSVDRLVGEKKAVVSERFAVPASTILPPSVKSSSVPATPSSSKVTTSAPTPLSPKALKARSGGASRSASGGGAGGRFVRPIDPNIPGDAGRFLREFAEFLEAIRREAEAAERAAQAGRCRLDAGLTTAQITAIRRAVTAWLSRSDLTGDERAHHIAVAKRAARAVMETPEQSSARVARRRLDQAEAKIAADRPPARPTPIAPRVSQQIGANRVDLLALHSEAIVRFSALDHLAAALGISTSSTRSAAELADKINRLDESADDHYRHAADLDRAALHSWSMSAAKWEHRHREQVACLARARGAIERGDSKTIADVAAGRIDAAIRRLRKDEECRESARLREMELRDVIHRRLAARSRDPVAQGTATSASMTYRPRIR